MLDQSPAQWLLSTTDPSPGEYQPQRRAESQGDTSREGRWPVVQINDVVPCRNSRLEHYLREALQCQWATIDAPVPTGKTREVNAKHLRACRIGDDLP